MTAGAFARPTGFNARTLVGNAVLLAALTILGWSAPPAHAQPPAIADSVCAGPRADMAAVNQEIAVHNAKPHLFELPREQAAFDSYNAEADALDAKARAAQSRVDGCLTAAFKLGGGPSGVAVRTPMPPSLPHLIKHARTGAPDRQAEVEELVGVFDDAAQEYDDAWADQRLQGERQPEVGDADPAFSDRPIAADSAGQPQVTPDYIIPLSDVFTMSKFMDLSPESMWMVTMSPLNRQWISDQATLAKNSPSVADYTGVQEQWLQAQLTLADQVRAQLQDAISILADSEEQQGAGARLTNAPIRSTIR